MAHLHAILWPFHLGLRDQGRGGVGEVTARVRVRGGADEDRFIDLHDWSLYGVGERASGGGPHVHHHVALSSWDLLVHGEEGREGGKEINENTISIMLMHLNSYK